MFDKLKKIIEKTDAEYADIRYETKDSTVIGFSGKELTDTVSSSADGFVLRVLKNGGYAEAVFTKLEDAETALKRAEASAVLIGKSRSNPVKFADTPPVKETFKPVLKEDPRDVSFEEKLQIVKTYNDLALAYEKVASTTISYEEIIRNKFFVSSEGSEINEELVTNSLRGGIYTREGSLTQDVRLGAGGSDGFHSIRNLEKMIDSRVGIAINLLNAKPIKGGTYNCILNPSMTSVFIHEAFGHFSEADIIESLPAMKEKMKIGNKLGTDEVTIVDDPTIPNQLGFYKYDDEGVPARRTLLMEKGVLKGRLHSRRTAAEFSEPLSGHTVAEDYRYAPIVRMGNIYLEPGKYTLPEMLELLGDGLYILDAKGGQTSGENFTFGAQYGYEVKNGKISGMVRDINIAGNLYKTLNSIRARGNKLVLSKTGGCGKGQLNIRSAKGGPLSLIDNLIVGGV